MSVMLILIGLACGLLTLAIGVALLRGLRDLPRIPIGEDSAAWAAASLLVFGALLAWGSSLPALGWLPTSLGATGLGGAVSSMVLIAGLAVPLHVETGEEMHWSQCLIYVPALALAGLALVGMAIPYEEVPGSEWVTPIRFLVGVCAGLGARTLGQALGVIAAGAGEIEPSRAITYAFLTLLAGSAALLNLWQRGTVWVGADPVVRGSVAGAWLVWSADWLAGSTSVSRLRAALTSAASLLLILVAVRGW